MPARQADICLRQSLAPFMLHITLSLSHYLQIKVQIKCGSSHAMKARGAGNYRSTDRKLNCRWKTNDQHHVTAALTPQCPLYRLTSRLNRSNSRLRKATIIFISVCPSVCLRETTQPPLYQFS